MSKSKEIIKQNSLHLLAHVFSDSKTQPEPVRKVDCTHEQIRYYANTPNTIIFYDDGESKGFFRECRKHEDKRQYLYKLIDEYCRFVFVNEYSEECKKIILDKLKDPANFNKFFNMGAGTATYTRITKFRRTLDSEWIGISKPYPDWFEQQLLQLVQYVWGALEDYKFNSFQKKNLYHVYNSNRTISTKRIADILGAEKIVPRTEVIELTIDGERKVGVSVDVANGDDPNHNKAYGVTSRFHKETVLLNLADAICYQKDHRPGNYFVEMNSEGYADSLCAFDNDCPTTLMPFGKANFRGYIGYSPIIYNGHFNRPFIGKDCFQKLMILSKNDIARAIKESSSKIETFFAYQRFLQLKKAVNKSVQNGITKVLDDTEWTQDKIDEEISGKYGDTYLKHFVDNYCIARN